ncbi:MAG: CotH kinase family protein [Bacteroidia bacterium]
MKKRVLIFVLIASFIRISAQSLPAEMHFSPDGRTLISGKQAPSGLYDSTLIREFRLNFSQSNYWQQMTANYATRTPIPASLSVDGLTLDSVGVGFKGNTSYQGVQNSQKKSFNITTDDYIDNQELMNYSTLNLNNAYQDESFLREVFYLHQIRKHIPAAKANFVHLFINEQDWGLYPNVQQLNKDFIEQWFYSNDGANFRAHVRTAGGPGGGPGGGSAQWGDGTAGLNYLGTDTALYQEGYTLKSSDIDSSWQHLVNGCYELNTIPANQLSSDLPQHLDIDRTLWFLASEIAFSDDDSYIFKGKMDYYVYFDPETRRLTPLEFDGNSVMAPNATTWSPFYNVNNVNYPLLNRLLTNPEYRQRYLAHLRVIIQDELNPVQCNAVLDNYKTQIDALVEADPKKLYTYTQFLSEVEALKSWIGSRNTYLNSNSEVAQQGPQINYVKYINSEGEEWSAPTENTEVNVQAQINLNNAVFGVYLYYSNQLTGIFEKVAMVDDGAHNDGAPGDGIFGASIGENSAGTYVRFYVEAVANNAQKSVSYLPRGAEHDVFVYQVRSNTSSVSGPVINEIMASNSAGASDQMGEYDDWIELYNNSSNAIDISGFYLTDNALNLDKWEIPAGTILPANGYLIFWADEDSSQGENHCNFKLSSLGESVMLFDADLNLVDSLNFGVEQTDVAFARIPNGTGNFVHQAPTFNTHNENGSSGINSAVSNHITLYPVPARERLHIKTDALSGESYAVFDAVGTLIYKGFLQSDTEINTSEWASGVYLLKVGSYTQRFTVQR